MSNGTALLAAIPGVGPFLAGLFGGLKEVGIIRTQEDEIKAQAALASFDAQSFQVLVDWVKATTPAADQTPRWVNGFIAMTRPAITWLIVGSIVSAFFNPGVAERIAATLEAFGKAGIAGMLFISIPGWWFFGRSMEKVLFGRFMGNGNGNHKDDAGELQRLRRLNDERNRAVLERDN